MLEGLERPGWRGRSSRQLPAAGTLARLKHSEWRYHAAQRPLLDVVVDAGAAVLAADDPGFPEDHDVLGDPWLCERKLSHDLATLSGLGRRQEPYDPHPGGMPERPGQGRELFIRVCSIPSSLALCTRRHSSGLLVRSIRTQTLRSSNNVQKIGTYSSVRHLARISPRSQQPRADRAARAQSRAPWQWAACPLRSRRRSSGWAAS